MQSFASPLVCGQRAPGPTPAALPAQPSGGWNEVPPARLWRPATSRKDRAPPWKASPSPVRLSTLRHKCAVSVGTGTTLISFSVASPTRHLPRCNRSANIREMEQTQSQHPFLGTLNCQKGAFLSPGNKSVRALSF